MLTNKEVSAARYSRGYAYAKLFDAAPQGTANGALLTSALRDFRISRDLDRDRDKAQRAADRVADRRRRADAERRKNGIGSVLVGSLATLVFVLAQLTFYFHFSPLPHVSGTYYSTFTFGSLLFIIAGLYLPNLRRLKLVGIELEKKPVEQIGASMPLGVTR